MKPKAKRRPDAMPMRPLKWFKPYERNPRKNDGVVDRMVASIQEFGFKIPVLARSNGEVVDGHLRLKAATRLNVAQIPVILCDEWTPAQVKAFRLLVNRSVGWAEWDTDLLRLEVLDLKELDFNLELTGFDENEIAGFLSPATTGLTDENAVPDPPKEPTTRPGDLWLLGAHRLLCGDSTSATDVERLLGEVKPGLMVTDPPYGVSYDPTWRDNYGPAASFARGDKMPANGFKGKRSRGSVKNDDRADWKDAYSLFPGSIAYVWHGGLHATTVAKNLIDCDFKLRAQIIWRKQHFVFGRGDYHWQHEPCWYAVKKTGNWTGDRKQSTIWDIQNLNPMGGNSEEKASQTNHGTQKPVECMRRPIVNHTDAGQTVYDPFIGSGTTIIAAESTGRSCYGIDIDPVYVDVAVQRWENFTGHKATLAKR